MKLTLFVDQKLPNGEIETSEIVSAQCKGRALVPDLSCYINDWLDSELCVSSEFNFILSLKID